MYVFPVLSLNVWLLRHSANVTSTPPMANNHNKSIVALRSQVFSLFRNCNRHRARPQRLDRILQHARLGDGRGRGPGLGRGRAIRFPSTVLAPYIPLVTTPLPELSGAPASVCAGDSTHVSP